MLALKNGGSHCVVVTVMAVVIIIILVPVPNHRPVSKVFNCLPKATATGHKLTVVDCSTHTDY